MNDGTGLWFSARCAAIGASLVLMQSPAAAGTDDYRLLFGQGNATATGTAETFVEYLDPAYNTGYVWGGSALSTNGSIGVVATSDVSAGDMDFSLYAEVGELRGQIQSSSNTGVVPGSITGANALGNTVMRWGDSFTVIGAPGTLVRMRARIELVATGGVHPFSVNSAPGGGPIGNALTYDVTLPVVGRQSYTCLDRNGSCSFSHTFEFDVFSGSKQGMDAYLNLQALSGAISTTLPNPLPTQSVTSFDARGRVFLDVLTPDFRYITSSGVDLTSPVPEPSTAATLLAGLLLMGGLAKRRLRR